MIAAPASRILQRLDKVMVLRDVVVIWLGQGLRSSGAED